VDAILFDLKANFALKDLGNLHYFLGIEVKSLPDGLLLAHHKYAMYLLCRVGMLACKAVSTPMSTSMKLSAHEGEHLGLEDTTNYHSVVGSLQYISHTHPDLPFTINKACQYLQSPMMAH
jgi:hypothetical protein